MQLSEDYQLLRQFCADGSQEALDRLVARHIDMVYAAALRQVRDPGMAEDVVQATFIIFARKAPSMGPGTIVSAWLLNTARFVAKDALKARCRRLRYEQAAGMERLNQMSHHSAEQNQNQSSASIAESPSALDGVLDRAIGKLGRAPREALVLRFFERQSFSQVAQRLGISEPAARKRVSRAVRELRVLLGRSGVTMGPEALTSALCGIGMVSAPGHLLPSVTAAVTHGAASKAAAAWSAGALRSMWLVKVKLSLVTLAATCAVVGGGATIVHLARSRTAVARPVLFQAGDDFAPVVGFARTPQGAPVAGAEVLLATATHTASLYGQGHRGAAAYAITGADGSFRLEPTEEPLAVVVRGSAGAGIASVAELRKSPNIVVRRWGSVKGTVKKGPQAVPDATVNVSNFTIDWRWHIDAYQTVTADGHGAFEVSRVFAGDAYIGWQPPGDQSVTHWYHCDVEDGKTAQLEIGGSGRKIIGHATGEFANDEITNGYLDPLPPIEFKLDDWRNLSESVLRQRWDQAKQSPVFRKWQAAAQPYMFHLEPDGSFEVDDVPEGRYRLRMECGTRQKDSSYIEFTATASQALTVSKAEQSDKPQDVGQIVLAGRSLLAVGQLAPPISGKDVAGQPLALTNFRGKYVLLHLWSSTRDDTVNAIEDLRPVFDQLGNKLVILGVNLDESKEDAQKALSKNAVPWKQIYIDRGWGALPEAYRNSPGTIFMIDPEGKVAAKNIEPRRALETAESVLSGGGAQ